MVDIFVHSRPIAWAWDEPETDASPGGYATFEQFLSDPSPIIGDSFTHSLPVSRLD